MLRIYLDGIPLGIASTDRLSGYLVQLNPATLIEVELHPVEDEK